MDQAVVASQGITSTLIYFYLFATCLIAGFLVMKSDSRNKFELFLFSYFLLTGSYNELLTFKIPGLSFLEIQPDRFIFFVLVFLILRKFFSSEFRQIRGRPTRLPSFLIFLTLFSVSVIISQATHAYKIGFAEVIVQSTTFLNFMLIVYSIRLIADRSFIKVIGKVVIITAVLSSIISLLQLGMDYHFMRVGDFRQAFGSVIRSNGIFSSEYTHSYLLIIAIFWTLTSLKDSPFKWLLMGLFVAGVFTSFHRMSWLILSLTLVIYFLRIQKFPLDRLLLASLTGIAVLLFVFIFAYRDIANSSLVKDRLNDSIRGREGYWTMVADHIGEKPFFGFGNTDNDVYYRNMLQITGDRNRATGESGDIHNGYLQALFIFGIPSFVFFAGFVIMVILYFGKLLKYDLFFAIPFLFSLLYGVANLTNNFLFNKPLAVIFAIHLGIGMGARYLKDLYPIEPAKI